MQMSRPVRIIRFFVALTSAFALMMAIALPAYAKSYSNYSTRQYAWGLGQNTSHKTPSGEMSAKTMKKYNAYYVGKTSKKDKVMYLTFDCGYENGQTSKILDTLKKRKVKAIFFVTSYYVKTESKLVKRMKREGHLVGNHTVNHKHMASLSPSTIKKELKGVEKLMKKKTGYKIDKFFRPPYGEFSKRTLKVVQDMGYTTILWSMALYDYDEDNQPGMSYVVSYFNKRYHPGAMPLLHVISRSDRQALDSVIKNMKKKGYRFATLDELNKKKAKKKAAKSTTTTSSTNAA